jgi:nitroreductase
MEFFELIRQRRSVRAFKNQPVEDFKLRKILEAANAAPSAGNLQAYQIYFVTKSDHLHKLARAAAGQDFVATAPVVLVFCTNQARNEGRYGQRGTQLYAVQDATVACTFAMLAVTALGLATVWVGAFRDEDVQLTIGAPAWMHPVAMLPIGYAAESPEPTPRRKLLDLVHEVT